MKTFYFLLFSVFSTLVVTHGVVDAAPRAFKKSQLGGDLFIKVPKNAEPVQYTFKGKTHTVKPGKSRRIPFAATDVLITKGSKLVTFSGRRSARDCVRTSYTAEQDFILPNLKVNSFESERFVGGLGLPGSELVELGEVLNKIRKNVFNPFDFTDLDATDGN